MDLSEERENLTKLFSSGVRKHEIRARLHLFCGVIVILAGFSFFVWDKHRSTWFEQNILFKHSEKVENLVLSFLDSLNVFASEMPVILREYAKDINSTQKYAHSHTNQYPINSSGQITWNNPELFDSRKSNEGNLIGKSDKLDQGEVIRDLVANAVGREFASWKDSISSIDVASVAELRERNSQISEQYDRVQESLLQTEQLLSDQFEQREEFLFRYSSALEEMQINQDHLAQDLLATASPLVESLRYLESAVERAMFIAIILSLSGLFFLNFRAASKTAKQYEMLGVVVSVAEPDNELIARYLDQMMPNESNSQASKFSLLEKLRDKVFRDRTEKGD